MSCPGHRAETQGGWGPNLISVGDTGSRAGIPVLEAARGSASYQPRDLRLMTALSAPVFTYVKRGL